MASSNRLSEWAQAIEGSLLGEPEWYRGCMNFPIATWEIQDVAIELHFGQDPDGDFKVIALALDGDWDVRTPESLRASLDALYHQITTHAR